MQTSIDNPSGGDGFAELFAAAYSRLWLLAAALVGDRVEAEDLVQEAALVGLEKFARFEPGSNFHAWMARIVRFQASNWRSKRARRRTQASDPVDLDRESAGEGAPPEPEVAESAAGRLGGLVEGFDDAVVRALDTVAPEPRACLLLRVVHDLSYDEIAEMLSIPAGTAMSHVHRTRSKLRKRLAEAPSVEDGPATR